MSNGIYVHIPFCLAKCGYCDFNSYAGKNDLIESYVERLLKEIKTKAGAKVDTVYIGGGTPTILKANLLCEILNCIFDCYEVESGAEVTVESNPATADLTKLKELIKAGANRLSIGVQSFHDNELKALSRIHNASDAQKAVLTAKEAGFENINIDLMYGIPLQTLFSFEETLERAIALDIEHISAYSLIIEENTPFWYQNITVPDEDEERDMHSLAIEKLKENGFMHYEISNFAKRGKKSRHNMRYWIREPYFGFGAGAHSFFGEHRYENVKSIEKYIWAENPVCSDLEISQSEAENERFMLGFRLIDGFETRGHFADRLEALKEKGLIFYENGNAKLTKRGLDLANQVFMEFVGED
ncbi:MAG: radical SAM family heme chaperone HemW [Bacillota bacterium]|nr:radical SAM family heme chaperone HemW [Bacillota bacterium]